MKKIPNKEHVYSFTLLNKVFAQNSKIDDIRNFQVQVFPQRKREYLMNDNQLWILVQNILIWLQL